MPKTPSRGDAPTENGSASTEFTRREVLKRCALLLAALPSSELLPSVVKSSLGSRRSILEEDSEQMSRKALQNWLDFLSGKLSSFTDDVTEELYLAIFASTASYTSMRADVTFNALKVISGRNVFMGSFLRSLSCPNLATVVGTQQFQGSPSLETVDLPNLVTVRDFNWWFFGCTSLRRVDLGKVEALGNPYNASFSGCSSLEDVYLRNMKSSTLLSYSNMMTPSTSGYHTPHQAVFHCEDGDVAWSDEEGSWRKEP